MDSVNSATSGNNNLINPADNNSAGPSIPRPQTLPITDQTPLILRRIESLDYPFKQEDLEQIAIFGGNQTITEPTYFNKKASGLKRSIIVIPSGENAGIYVLCKAKGTSNLDISGGGGRVTVAYNIQTGKRLAIKSIKSDVKEEKRGVLAVNNLHKLGVPGANRLVNATILEGAGENGNKTFLLMPYYPDGDMLDKMNALRVELDSTRLAGDEEKKPVVLETLDYFMKAGKILQILVQNKIAHLDFKWENLFIREDNELILGDFTHLKNLSVERNMASTRTGTPGYQSPEIMIDASEEFPLYSSDMWSLGIMLTMPFINKNVADDLEKIGKDYGTHKDRNRLFNEMRRYIQRIPDYAHSSCPPGCVAIIQRLLDFDPNTRMKPDEFVAAMEEAQEQYRRLQT